MRWRVHSGLEFISAWTHGDQVSVPLAARRPRNVFDSTGWLQRFGILPEPTALGTTLNKLSEFAVVKARESPLEKGLGGRES